MNEEVLGMIEEAARASGDEGEEGIVDRVCAKTIGIVQISSRIERVRTGMLIVIDTRVKVWMRIPTVNVISTEVVCLLPQGLRSCGATERRTYEY